MKGPGIVEVFPGDGGYVLLPFLEGASNRHANKE